MTNPVEPADAVALPLRDLTQFVVDAASVQLLGERFCRRKRVVVLGDALADAAGPVTIGMTDPSNTALVDTVRQFLDRALVPVRLTDHDIDTALDRGHERENPSGVSIEFGGDSPEMSQHPMHQVLRSILQQAVEWRASALHIDVAPERAGVRARVDGVLRPLPSALDPTNGSAFLARLGALAGLEPATQDGPRHARLQAMLQADGAPVSIGIDIESIVCAEAESVVLRLQPDAPRSATTLEQLGALPQTADRIRAALAGEGRALLLCGAARSGRTQTLASCLAHRAAPERKTVVLGEAGQLDVEHVDVFAASDGADAVEWVEALGRHDADTLALDLGNARSAEDLMSTHPSGAAMRLIVGEAMGPAASLSAAMARGCAPMRLADQVAGVVHQRLLRRRCTSCGGPSPSTDCEACGSSGWRGSVGVFEFLELVPSVARCVAAGATAMELRDAAIAQTQMTTAFDNATAHVAAGLTTAEEVARALPPRLRSPTGGS